MVNEDKILTEEDVAIKGNLLRLLTSNDHAQVELGLQIQEGLQFTDIQLAIDTALSETKPLDRTSSEIIIDFRKSCTNYKIFALKLYNEHSSLLLLSNETKLGDFVISVDNDKIKEVYNIPNDVGIMLINKNLNNYSLFSKQINSLVKNNGWIRDIRIKQDSRVGKIFIDNLVCDNLTIRIDNVENRLYIRNLSQSTNVTIISNDYFKELIFEDFKPPKNRLIVQTFNKPKTFESGDYDDIVNAITTFNATVYEKVAFSISFVFTERNPRFVNHEYFVGFWQMVENELKATNNFIDHTTSGTVTLTIVLTQAPSDFYRMWDSLGVVVRSYNKKLDSTN